MFILRKIWSIIKSVFAAFSKEPVNNQLDVGIPENEDEVSTDAPVVDAPEVTTDPTTTAQVPNQPN